MRRLGTLVGYWVAACAVSLALFGLGLTQARLLLPLGRVLLIDRQSGWRDLRSGRRWAEAVGLTLAWIGVPELLYMAVGDRFVDAGIRLPWMSDSHIGGTVVWWWVGVAFYFGLLHRRVLAALVGGAFALLWQWAVLGAEAVPTLRPFIPSDLVISYLLFGLFMGLILALADFLAGWRKAAPNRS